MRISEKLSADHGREGNVNLKKLRTIIHKVNPSKARIVINKHNIIPVSTLGDKRRRTPYIRVNQIKMTLRHRLTRLIREL